jgi:hypothetical protein
MPFCGLHKVGGLAAQESSYVPPSSAPAVMQRDEEAYGDGTPGLSFSQRTISSTQGSFASVVSPTVAQGNKKRTYEEEMEEEMDAFFDEAEIIDPVPAGRTFAKPKASMRRAVSDGVMLESGGSDFEDAAFLAPMDVDEH